MKEGRQFDLVEIKQIVTLNSDDNEIKATSNTLATDLAENDLQDVACSLQEGCDNLWSVSSEPSFFVPS